MQTTLGYITAIQNDLSNGQKHIITIFKHGLTTTSYCIYLQELESDPLTSAATTSEEDAIEHTSDTTPLSNSITKEAITIAHSLVKTSLKQLCKYPYPTRNQLQEAIASPQ